MTSDLFTPASVSALLSAVVSLFSGAGALVLGRAPDWDDVKPLAAVGFTGALVAACNFTATLDVPLPVYAWTGRLEVLAVALHVAAWFRYALQWARPLAPSRIRLLLAPLLVAGAAAVVPGLVFGDAVTLRPVRWLGVVYHDPALAVPGAVVLAVIAAYGAGGVFLVWAAGRRGLPFPRTHLAVVAALLAMGAHDAVVVVGVSVPTPYLLDFAFYGPAAVIAVITLSRVVGTATDLHRLRAGLETAVVERTRALEQSQAALARAERLAALGQFSAGFAHEVNNPAAVISASLEHLAGALRDDPRDQVWASVQDAQAALGRVTALTRELLVAGRTAHAKKDPLVDVRLGPAADAALKSGRARGVKRVALEASLPAGLTAVGREAAIVQVLSNLVVNAVQAFPDGRSGTVRVGAETASDRVRILVEDDGEGMSEQTLLHVFEPFYGTRAPGTGSGLGLAVSRGLVEQMGGTLVFESAAGKGTRAILELARGEQAASAADLPAAVVRPAPRRARILVVDDDPHVLRAIARFIATEHDVSVAPGLWKGLSALTREPWDLVLCDVMMPMGGGARFWEELLLRAPEVQGRVVFMTGGAATEAAREFLDRQPQPVLQKPFDLAAVQAVMEKLGIDPRERPERPRAPGDVVLGKLHR